MNQSPISEKPVIHAVNEFLAFLHSEYPKINRIVLALSGGKDSVCLLHALNQRVSNYQLKAVYIDHCLQSVSAEWSQINQEFCQSLNIDFESVKVNVDRTKASLEQEARNARYKSLETYVDEQTCLVTAQHQDDQAETVLLQLFRGAGTKGLAAMPYIKSFADGFHARPLLNTSQADIRSYIEKYQLPYIQDPTNQDVSIRRNFLRHQVLPVLEKEWKNLCASLAKVATNQAETQTLIDEVAANDLRMVKDGSCLKISELRKFSQERLNNLLRFWLASLDIRLPSRRYLAEIKEQLLTDSDSDPIVDLDGWELRRYRNDLYAIKPQENEINFEQEWKWLVANDFKEVDDQSISLDKLLKLWPELEGETVTVRYRREGDKCYSPNKAHSQSLKNYFQEKAVPTWLRDSALMVVHQDKVIFIQEKNL